MQVAGALAKAAESFMDGVNFDLEVPLQVRLCSLRVVVRTPPRISAQGLIVHNAPQATAVPL